VSELLTTRDVMERLGVRDPQKVYDLIRERKIRAINNGTDRRATWRFRPADVETYLASRSIGPESVSSPTRPLPVPTRRFLKY
jgi:excisionase family DNA binding protein